VKDQICPRKGDGRRSTCSYSFKKGKATFDNIGTINVYEKESQVENAL
jgi:hypothetical protein